MDAGADNPAARGRDRLDLEAQHCPQHAQPASPPADRDPRGILALTLLAPVAIAFHARRDKVDTRRAAVPAIASSAIAAPLILVTLEICWATHGCYT